MKRIETVSELRQIWSTIISVLRHDLNAAGRLASDPVGTITALGYEMGDEAQSALRDCLPASNR